ncbi:MAG TPA: hypothetical protein VLM79_22560, partial [Kofleriaceae bacterium]|nr:hypothetical protein [Kofleriaceae bacterium]
CCDAYATATKQDTLTVTLGLKSAFIPSEYEDEPGTFVIKIDPAAPQSPSSPEAAADTCVRQVLEPAIKSLKLTDAFTTKLAVTIK